MEEQLTISGFKKGNNPGLTGYFPLGKWGEGQEGDMVENLWRCTQTVRERWHISLQLSKLM